VGAIISGFMWAFLIAAAAMLIVSVAFLVFGFALQELAKGMTALATVDWTGLMASFPVILGLAAALFPLGLVGALLAVPLLMLSATFMVLGPAIQTLATGLISLTTVDWASLETVPGMLMRLAGGLALFALAGLLFLNPIMLIGMLLMIGTLYAISVVLIPLAESLEMGGAGLDSMASGVLKLSDSLSKLDFEKLEQLKKFSQAMSLAAATGGLMNAMAAISDAMSKSKNESGESGGGTKTVIVQLKMPNGRVLEEHIIKDIDKAT
jgi:hypothetical protein